MRLPFHLVFAVDLEKWPEVGKRAFFRIIRNTIFMLRNV
jgi:hypothetical protein